MWHKFSGLSFSGLSKTPANTDREIKPGDMADCGYIATQKWIEGPPELFTMENTCKSCYNIPQGKNMRETKPPKPPQTVEHRTIDMTPQEVQRFFLRMDMSTENVGVSVTKAELHSVIANLLTDISVDAAFVRKQLQDNPDHVDEAEYQRSVKDLKANSEFYNRLMDVYLHFDES